jgi:hypothetical protein
MELKIKRKNNLKRRKKDGNKNNNSLYNIYR